MKLCLHSHTALTSSLLFFKPQEQPIKITGALYHRTQQDNTSFGIVLAFNSREEAQIGLKILSKHWLVLHTHPLILSLQLTARQLEKFKEIAVSDWGLRILPCGYTHCQDQCRFVEIDHIRHSIDQSTKFSLELAVQTPRKELGYLY